MLSNVRILVYVRYSAFTCMRLRLVCQYPCRGTNISVSVAWQFDTHTIPEGFAAHFKRQAFQLVHTTRSHNTKMPRPIMCAWVALLGCTFLRAMMLHASWPTT